MSYILFTNIHFKLHLEFTNKHQHSSGSKRPRKRKETTRKNVIKKNMRVRCTCGPSNPLTRTYHHYLLVLLILQRWVATQLSGLLDHLSLDYKFSSWKLTTIFTAKFWCVNTAPFPQFCAKRSRSGLKKYAYSDVTEWYHSLNSVFIVEFNWILLTDEIMLPRWNSINRLENFFWKQKHDGQERSIYTSWDNYYIYSFFILSF